MRLSRARAGKNIEKADELQLALFNGMRKAALAPAAGPVAVTDKLSTRLLFLYERLRPLLKADDVATTDAMWILAEYVFVPTAALIVIQNRQRGLGTEFEGADCWYLPEKIRNLAGSPIQRVLERWLRVAGFRTAYGVSKEMKSEPLRRKVDRWRRGEIVPTLQSLWHLVGKFPQEVSWLDRPEAWKARFTLACAVQKAFAHADDYFGRNTGSAAKLVEIFHANIKQEFFEDDGGILLLEDIFWAVCLVDRRLRAEGKFDRLFAKMPPANWHKQWGPKVSDQEIERWRRKREWESKRGNWFALFLAREARKAKRIGSVRSLDDSYHLKEFVFELGVNELNRLLAERRK